LTNEEREIQKKLREVAREARDKGKWVKIGYRKIQINGWLRWERGETQENFFRRRREEEKTTLWKKVLIFTDKVNKKVDGQRKWKTGSGKNES
jgi:hypothetical protein